jgi:hypothetical protein
MQSVEMPHILSALMGEGYRTAKNRPADTAYPERAASTG